MRSSFLSKSNDPKGERGSIIVESALIMPLVLFITLGIFQLSLIYVARSVLNYATYSASRAVMVGEDPQVSASMICSVISGVADNVPENSMNIPGWGDLPRYDYAMAKTRVSVIEGTESSDEHVTVVVEHDYQLILPSFRLLVLGSGEETFKTYEENGDGYITLSDSCTIPKPWE